MRRLIDAGGGAGPLVRRLAASALAVLLLVGVASVPAFGASGGLPPAPTSTFGLRAGFYGFTRLAHNHFTFSVPRGTTVHDSVDVFSLSNKPVTVRLYPADLIVAQGGALTPAQEAAPRTGAGGWITLTRHSLTLAPRQVVVVPFTLRVPKTATPGEHAAAVVGSTLLGRTSAGLTVETRVALQAIVTVQGKTHLGLTVDDPKLGSDGHTVTVTVHNTGNVLLTLSGRADLGGATADLGPQDLYVIPGGDATLTAHLRHLPWLGRYRLTAHLQAALDGKPIGRYTSSAGLWFVPWGVVIAVLAAVAMVVVALRATRARRSVWRERRREEKAVVAEYRASRSDS